MYISLFFHARKYPKIIPEVIIIAYQYIGFWNIVNAIGLILNDNPKLGNVIGSKISPLYFLSTIDKAILSKLKWLFKTLVAYSIVKSLYAST